MIARDHDRATERVFDLAIVGGGIYGATLLHAAARSGLSACLCEAQDFGGGTSSQSLRIVHGGLRYLQTMDLRRFRQSVRARRGFARVFPSIVRPLDCLMPLYGDGMKRPEIMRLALLANDLLSADRNSGVPESAQLPGGQVLTAAQTQQAFPQVRSEGLRGAARWSDYFMRSSERILIEYVRDACRLGALALNYTRCAEIVGDGKRVHGVRVEDRLTRRMLTIRARAVVNCCGPQVQTLLHGREGEREDLFIPSLAFNLLLDTRLPDLPALAVAAPQAGAQVLFLVPQAHSVLAGTMHLPRPVGTIDAKPSEAEIEDFLAQLRAAIPGFDMRRVHVKRIFAGLLPARAADSAALVKREVLRDHGASGGLRGLYSIAGVKYTTAADVARQILLLMGSRCDTAERPLPLSSFTPLLIDARQLRDQNASTVRGMLRQVAREESVQTLDDLLLRRTNWATTELDLHRLRHYLEDLMGKDWNLKVGRT
jgi:glycerol-3-phosphate dehydrogenase